MSLAFPVRHEFRGWLKNGASLNMSPMDTAAPNCHESMFWLNGCVLAQRSEAPQRKSHPLNMPLVSVTIPVCQELRGWLNPPAS